MDKDELGAFLIVAALMAVVGGLAYAIYCLIEYSVVAQSGALVLAAVATVIVFQRVSRQASVRAKVATLFCLYLCFIFLFAGAYAIAFFRTPSIAFRLSDDALTEQVRGDLKLHMSAISFENENLAFVRLMRGKAGEIATMVDRANYDDVNERLPLSPTMLLNFSGKSKLVAPPEKPTATVSINVGGRFELVAGRDERLACFGQGTLKCELTTSDQVHLAEMLSGADNASKVRAALDNYSKGAAARISAHDASALRILRDQPNLEMSHFVYFSAAIMTTVGTGDIIPNSWITRYLVVLQALFAVFFLGYALHVFWPEQAKD